MKETLCTYGHLIILFNICADKMIRVLLLVIFFSRALQRVTPEFKYGPFDFFFVHADSDVQELQSASCCRFALFSMSEPSS